jgi:palmitoyl-[glycerolipid] 3-(E)-desaturase
MITRNLSTAALTEMNERRRSHGLRFVVAVATTAACAALWVSSLTTTLTLVDAFSTMPTVTTTITRSTATSVASATTSRLFSTTTSSPSPPSLTLTEQQHQQQQQDEEKESQTLLQQQQQQLSSSNKKSWTDDGFVFGLEGSGLARPGGRTSQIVVEGDSLETKPYQQVLVYSTLAAHAGWILASFHNMLALQQSSGGNVMVTCLQAVVLLLSSWILADFGSGVLHWSVDNYGNGRTPIMGSIIAAFQGHHSAPWTITERGFCNNVYKLCLPFGLAPMTLFALTYLVTGGAVGQPGAGTFFLSIFCVFEILSQEFHKWSHQLKSETPRWVNVLQDWRLTIARKPHALHHLAPYEGNYCIISGICNPTLDKFGVFRRLEHVVYQLNGVESNAWKLDAALRAKTLAGDYSLPATAKTAKSSKA